MAIGLLAANCHCSGSVLAAGEQDTYVLDEVQELVLARQQNQVHLPADCIGGNRDVCNRGSSVCGLPLRNNRDLYYP